MQKKKYDFFSKWETLKLEPKWSKILSYIYQCKGKQDLFIVERPDVIKTLTRVAMINSTISSNAIENIIVSETRIKALMSKSSKPQNRNEEEVIGYKKVLDLIHTSYSDIDIKPNIILQLHRDLFSKVTKNGNYGKWKISDNTIQEITSDGRRIIRFKPTPASETSFAMEALCVNYNNAINKYNDVEPLFLIGEFILSFLCIHPFDDGNGRMSRLLTLLLMYKAGYTVGKYISIEKMIEKTKDSYYKSLYESSQSWEREQNNSMYFINYFIFVIEQVYGQFVKRAIEVTTIKKKKSELVKDIFDNELGRITKSRIKELLPNVSEATIEVALDSLTKKSYIQKFGDRKHAFYIKKNE